MAKLLFDLNGVILPPKSDQDIASLEQVVRPPDRVLFWDVYTQLRGEYDTGGINDEAWWRQVALRANLPAFNVVEAVTADFSHALLADAPVLHLLEAAINSGFVVGVVANMPLSLAHLVREQHRWLDDIAAVTLSCDIGVAIPHQAAYAVAVDALGGPAKDTHYFAFSAAYSQAGRRAGMHAQVYPGIAATRDLLADLKP